MLEDHYATLGVAPRSEAAAIRAAYLDLMRRYHPDKNDSPTAVERAHAIIAAFAVLGNVEQRLRYDWARRREAEAAAAPPPSWFARTPKPLIAGVVALLLLVPLSLMRAPVATERPAAAPMADIEASPPVAPKPVASARPLAAAPPTIVPEPVAAAEPTPVTPQGRPESRPAERAAQPALPPAPRVVPAPRARPQAVNAAAPTATPPASANPKCLSVRPGAEAAICNNDNLAALDRNVVAFYNQSLQFGPVANRGPLLDARNSFLARREACRSDECLQGVHLAHLRELATIVERRDPSTPR